MTVADDLQPSEQRFRELYEVLRESEARFRTMADSAPVLLWMSGTDSLCNFFNEQWLRFTGRPMEMEVGTGWAEGVHAEDLQACMDTYLTAFVARAPFRMEYRLRRADGAFRWLLDQGLPRYAPGGAFAGYIGSCVDVTELREATEAQRRNSRQLEVLVKEIHHRVKNNLQVVMSLLNLQARHITDPKVVELFRDTQARVRSIALLHERLYQSKDLANIGAFEYLSGVATSVRAAAGNSAPPIAIQIEAGGFTLPIDTAIPLGLIVNELVTNAFKYAFPHGSTRVDGDNKSLPIPHAVPTSDDPRGRGAEVRVSLSRVDASGGVELVVEDNGIGIPPGLDLVHSATLGLQLVRALVRQLGAELSLSTAAGTRWMIRTILVRTEHPDGKRCA